MNSTGYFTHRTCLKHEMGEGHPECPERLGAIEDRLLITGLGDALDRRDATPASISELELAHDRMYIASIRGIRRFMNHNKVSLNRDISRVLKIEERD